jgi:large subunit ribosomal protein LP0
MSGQGKGGKSGGNEGLAKKMDYMNKLKAFMEEFPRIILVTCDNIGSKHMQQIRSSLRGRATLLMGKNTLIRKAIKNAKDDHPEWQDLLLHIKGNVGLVFTKEELNTLHPKLLESRVPAQAKVGIVAPQDVILPAQVTTLEPTKTNFFAALDIATKITRGCVEILNDVKLCQEGKKVGSSEAALLQMLDMRPFTYGLKLTTCYDEGVCFDSKLLSVTKAHVYKAFGEGVGNVAALSLAAGFPTLPAFPHVVGAGFRNLLAVSLATDYTFKQSEAIKTRAAAPVEAPKAVVKEEPKKPEPQKAPAKPAPPPKKDTTSEEEEFGDIFS